MKAFVMALLGTVALMLQLPTSGAQRSLTLTSNVSFDVTPLPSLCPGSTVQFNCVAVMFNLGVDWERNGMQFQQYTATSRVNMTENPRSGLFVVLNSVIDDPSNVTLDSTVTAVVNEGISSGDVITCGNGLLETTDLTANYIAIPPPPQPPNTLQIKSSSSSSNNSVRLIVNFDRSFSMENRVEKYCIRSQNRACPNDSCVTPGGNYTCDGLEAGVEYNFTVRAINCRDQESNETDIITIAPQIPLRPSSCRAFAVYNQSSGALSGITTLWSRVEDPSNITNLIDQNVLFYNLSFVSTSNTDTVMLPLLGYDELCATDDSCNVTISNERLTGSGTNYRVQVVAGNIVGTGEPLNCDGQINGRNSVFNVSTTAPSSTDSTTTIKCRFSNPLPPLSNITRECELCYTTLVNSQAPSQCITQATTDGGDSLVTFRIQLPNSSGGPYGPFFYQLTAIEDNVTLAVIQGQQYTGCDPLLLGSVSSPEINSRCSSLLSSSGGGQSQQQQVVEGVRGDNGIIFCYSSPGGGGVLQGTVAKAYCDDGYEREGAESVTCGMNGSWGDLPRCSRGGQMGIEALLGWQVALIVIGVLLWFLAVGLDIVGVVLLILLAREKFNASFRLWHGLFIFLLILTALLLVVCIALWIALGVTVSNGRQVGDDAFVNARAGLCVAAFLLSLIAVISAIVALILTKLMPKMLSSKGSVEITHTEEIAKEISVEENNNKRYDTLPASPHEEIPLEISSERKEDLASNQAMVPVEISIVNNGEVTSDPSTQEEQHSITEHDGGDTMNGSREALLSEEEKQPKPIEDEAIRNLLHELQIEPLPVDTQAGNEAENTRGDEVAQAGQFVDS